MACIALHCAALRCTALHYSKLRRTTLHYSTLRYTTATLPSIAPLHYNIAQYSTQQDSTLHYTTSITPHHNDNYNYSYNCANHITATLGLHYNCECSCRTTRYIQQLWVRGPLQPLQPFQETQLRPLFSPSVDSICHPFITTPLRYCPIFETSATALCGTTGIET